MFSSIWMPPDPPDWQPSCPADYIDTCGHRFIPYNRRGYLSVPVLSNLTGHPWNEIAMAYVQGLRPSSLRVVKGEETTDAQTWRVTVYLDDQNKIEMIHQEVEVGLPHGINCGSNLRAALDRGIKTCSASN